MKKFLAIAILSTLAFTGCGNSDNFVVTNQNVNLAAPTCVDDNYATNSNTQLTVAAANGVLSNDSPAGGTLVLQTASSQGGTVADNGQGAFTYTPATNFVGSDTFTYSITNAVGTTTCTVTITVTAVNGFFVDSTNGNDGTGSFTNGLPFATIQAAAAAAPAGSDIVVRPGNYTGAINLDNGDRLLGNGSTLVVNPRILTKEALETEAFNLVAHKAIDPANSYFVDSENGDDPTAHMGPDKPFQTLQAAISAAPEGADIVLLPGHYPGEAPLKNGQRLLGDGSPTTRFQLGATRPNLTGPVVLGDGNTVDFVRIANSPGLAIDGDGQNGAIVTNCQVDTTTDSGIQARPGTGTWTVVNNTVNNVTGIGIRLGTVNNGQMTAVVNNNTVTNSGFDAISFVTTNTSQCTAQVQGNTMTGNQAGATFEVISTETSVFCLDLENNTNDDVYRFAIENTATANVEQFNTLAAQQNSGTVTVQMTPPIGPPTDVANGFCGF